MKNTDITLILIPGLLSDGIVWQHAVKNLSSEIEVNVADISNSDSITLMAINILKAYDGELYIAGHSLGARVAIECYRLAPDRVQKLALIDTGTHPLAEGEPAKRQIVLDLAHEKGMQALADVWLPPMVHEDRYSDTILMTALTDMVLRADVAQHDRQIKALVDRPDAESMLRTIKCPTLLAVGRQDRWSPVSQHENMHAKITDSKLVIIEDAGHFAPIEQPEAMTAALREWILG